MKKSGVIKLFVIIVILIFLIGCNEKNKEIEALKKEGEKLSDSLDKTKESKEENKEQERPQIPEELNKQKEELEKQLDTKDKKQEVKKETAPTLIIEAEKTKTKEQLLNELGQEAVDMKAGEVVSKTYYAGQFIKLVPVATDLDGDHVTFRFSHPLDAKGEWQTTARDVGEYLVTVVASDGKTKVPKQVRLIIKAKNNPPEVQLSDVIVKEGEKIVLKPRVTDPENDPIKIIYTGWMKSAEYQTTYTDAGKYTVIVAAEDGEGNKGTKAIQVTVLDVNRVPQLIRAVHDVIVVREGETIDIKPAVSDAEQEGIKYTFSKPFDENGKWTPSDEDADEYTATITITDGNVTTSKSIKLKVEAKNHAPVLQQMQDWLIQMGETFTARPVATDQDGDAVTLTYSKPLDEKGVWKTKAGDNGVYKITVTASDGKEQVSRTFKLTVNAPPEFIIK